MCITQLKIVLLVIIATMIENLHATANVICYETLDKGSKSYRGKLSETVTGKTCQEWAKQTPHKHGLEYTGESNFCRNPIADEDKPWCYTTSSSSRWEYCDVPQCLDYSNRLCYEMWDKGFKSYRGKLSKTVTGKTCQEWAKQSPHKHGLEYTEESNFCRNPIGDEAKPWCYTTSSSSRWEFCDVPKCFPRGW